MASLEKLSPERPEMIAKSVTNSLAHATVTVGLEKLERRKHSRNLGVQADTRQ